MTHGSFGSICFAGAGQSSCENLNTSAETVFLNRYASTMVGCSERGSHRTKPSTPLLWSASVALFASCFADNVSPMLSLSLQRPELNPIL